MTNKYKTVFIPHSKVTAYNNSGKKHIAVLGGGMSAEREVSMVSSQEVIKALLELGYRVSFVDMGADIALCLTELKPDIVYNCLHGTYGEDGCLPGLLNIMRIPYTHSGLLASVLAFDKLKSKESFIANNIPTAKFIVVDKSDNIKTDPIKRPYVIKPFNQGSSIGVEVIFPEDEFDFASYDFPYGDKIIIEEYVKGREMQVAVLNGKALGVLELKFLKSRFFDYDAKYSEGFAQHLIPAPLPKKLYDELLSRSEWVSKIFGCKGISRVEFIFEPNSEEFFILEINTHPGMTPLSIVPDIAAYKGIDSKTLIEEILKTASFEV